jgi:nucleotide-binding universal stress UspA family protein
VLPHAKAIAQSVGSASVVSPRGGAEDGGSALQVDPLNWYLQKAEAQSYIDQVSQQWQQSSLSITNVLLEGPAAERVVEYAHDHDVDLIVLSNQSESGVAQKSSGRCANPSCWYGRVAGGEFAGFNQPGNALRPYPRPPGWLAAR